jgi:hypothetical protein
MSKYLVATNIYLDGTVNHDGPTSSTQLTLTDTTNQLVLGTTNTTTVSAPAPASSITLTLPNTADTLVGRATTDTLTNKSISGVSNTLSNIPITAINSGFVKTDGTAPLTSDWTTNNFGIIAGTATISSNVFQGAAYRNADGAGGASAVQLSNTGSNTGSSSVLISSANGGISINANGTDKNVTINTNGTGSLVVVGGQKLKADTINESTTNATTLTVANTGTSTNAGALTLSSTTGGITMSAPSGKIITMSAPLSSYNGYLFSYKTTSDQSIAATSNVTLTFNGISKTGAFNTSEMTATPTSGTFQNTSGRTQIWFVQGTFRQNGTCATDCVLQMWFSNGDGYSYGNSVVKTTAGGGLTGGTSAIITMAANATLSFIVYQTDSGAIWSYSGGNQPTMISIYCLSA